MKQLIVIWGLFSLSLFASAHNHKNPDLSQSSKKETTALETNKKFGGAITPQDTLTLSQVISDFDKYKGKTIVIEATTEKVCEQKGCWMVIKDGSHQVRTLFKDYGFFVPKDIVGQKVRVQGVMEQKKISAATLRHYKKDEGAKLGEIQKIKTGRMDYQFTADAVEVY